MVNRVEREKAVGCLRRKMKTGRPASASSFESVSKGERNEEKLVMTNIYTLKLSSPEYVFDFNQIICRGVTHVIIGPVAGSHL